MQSFADDSIGHKGDMRLFMAGFVGIYEVWNSFSKDWQNILDESPKIEYLKMAEAQNLRGQFRYWSEDQRNKKLFRFCEVLQAHNILSFYFSLSTKAYSQSVKPYAPKGLSAPHFAANFQVVSGISRYFESSNDLKIQFIFDTQKGVDADVHLFFEYMCRNLPKNAKDRINGIPIFLDDKDVLPLQAADMLAWFVRRVHHMGSDSLPIPLSSVISEYHIASEIPDSVLVRWGEEFSRIPNLHLMQSKSQWQKFRKEMKELIATGFVPPYGSGFKNSVNDIRERFARFIELS